MAAASDRGQRMSVPDWSVIKEDVFNRVVEALLVAEFSTDGNRARAIDGRGGDRGVDVGVWGPNGSLRHIFQLKHYRDGWSAKHGDRRRKIKDSFETAWQSHSLDGWTLVTASNPTLNELEYVKKLAGDREIAVDVMGPAELDAMLGKHPHVHDRFFGDRAVELLTAVHRPHELLRQPGDLPIVFRRIHERLKVRSDWWGTRATIEVDGSTTEELVALANDSHLREPLGISVETRFTPEHEELRESFEVGLRFGFVEPMILTPDVVSSLVKHGPEWWAEEISSAQLEVHPTDDGSGTPVKLTVLDGESKRQSTIDGQVVRSSRGPDGLHVKAQMLGGLNCTWRLPVRNTQGQLDLTYDTAGQRVRDVRRLARFLLALHENPSVALRFGDHPEIRITLSASELVPEQRFIDFLDDLITVEDAYDVSLSMPERDLTVDDRIWARVLTRIADGIAVPYPNIDGFTFTLQATTDPVIEQARRRSEAAVLVQKPDFQTSLLDQEVDVGHVFVYQSYGKLAVQHRRRDGEGQVAVSGSGDLPFLIYSPGRLKQGSPVPIEGWGIPEIPEHRHLHELQRRHREDVVKMPNNSQMRSTEHLKIDHSV